MTKRASHRVPDELFALRDQFVRVAGEILAVAVEQDLDPLKIDHIWINLRAGEAGRLQIALSTCSRQSRALGMDARLRMGIVTAPWSSLPPAGVERSPAQDYAKLEGPPINFIPYERAELEEMIVAKVRRAIFAEAWGALYLRERVGVHQVHSRRASLAVPRDLIGQDGALQLYQRAPDVRELFLFKFAGQA